MVGKLARRRSIRLRPARSGSCSGAPTRRPAIHRTLRGWADPFSGALEVVKEMKIFGRFVRRRGQDSWVRREERRFPRSIRVGYEVALSSEGEANHVAR